MKLYDERYEEIKEEVAELYKELHITKFPVHAMDVCKELGINLKTYNCFDDKTFSLAFRASEDGIVAKIDNQYYIFYNPSKEAARIRFTIFHEIGHIRLHHLVEDLENEAEADFFACYFLAPSPLIHFFELGDTQSIMDKFWVTFTFAVNARERYQKWLQFSGTGFTEYEKTLIRLAKEGIN